ncbi:MAG: ABC transporter substrate-binding protein, partial [Chloroflexi bacterium]|nr:ABC transporter substrate-binding protein [Chloroflexota bacterium]
YFAEQGLTVELQNVRNVDEMLAPLSTGKVDVSSMVVTTGFFNAMNQKLDFRLVAGASDPAVSPEPAPFLVVSKALVDSGEVKGVADLKGRKIAINLRGSGLEYLLHKGLEKSGLTVDDVELVTIPGGEMLAAVQNGAVDGAAAGILNVQRMIGEGVAVPLLNNIDAVETGDAGGLVFGQRLLQPENREVGIRFIVAYLQAVRFLNDGGWEKPEVVAILQKYTGMEPPMIARSPKIAFAEDGVIDEAGIQDVEAFQISQGYVEYTEAIPVEAMVELSMLAEALARLDSE